MVLLVLIILGLCMGSFVSALSWRLHQQGIVDSGKWTVRKKGSKPQITNHQSLATTRYSILSGRSMCPHCRHQLNAADLVPVLSWLSLGGRCRYCHKPISWQYPTLELATAGLFVLSYWLWPWSLSGAYAVALFGLWLVLLVILTALAVYDLRWMLLPDRLIWAGVLVALIMLVVRLQTEGDALSLLTNHVLGAAVGPVFFGAVYFYSKGRWIGFGDIKLSLLMGILLGLGKTLVALMLASYSALLVVLPLLALKKIKRTQPVPFGPFLILGTIASFLYGNDLIEWYLQFIA